VIETWKARGENRPTLCYGVNRAHAEHLQQRFIEAGIAAAYIDCATPRDERERIFDRFRAGELRVISNVATLSTGLDLPMVSCLIDARPTKSEIRFVQTIGRGLRTAPGKTDLLILDHAGNHLRLGLVTDIHHDRLDDGKNRKGGMDKKAERVEPLPRLCDECKAVLPARSITCSACGATREAKTTVIHRDGELVKLGSGRAPHATPSIAAQAKFFGEVKYIGNERKYAPGWASYQFKERFGHWPNDALMRNAAARPPSLETKNWIKARQIAFARAKARANG
jgi:superfamily II DNA or RNA helicase